LCGQGAISSAAWDGGTLFIAGGHTTINGTACLGSVQAVDPATGAYLLYAIDTSTGVVLWSYKTGYYIYSSPAIANGVVYVGSDDKSVYALNATTGAMLWGYRTGSYVISSPAVVDGVVYIGSTDHHLYAFHLPGKTP
jgi:eukaryotic-like serine/threonine-protein kinase